MRFPRFLVPALLLTTAFAALAPPAQAQECFDAFGTLPVCMTPPETCLPRECPLDACGNVPCPASSGPAEVKLFCIGGQGECPSWAAACVLYPVVVCVPNPCSPVCWDGALETQAAGLPSPGDVGVAARCVNYMYVADYHWYWLCVDPKADCPVYERQQHGVTVTEKCLVPAVSVQTALRCLQYAQDLDYAHYACVGDASCPVYTKRVSGGHEDRWCVVEFA